MNNLLIIYSEVDYNYWLKIYNSDWSYSYKKMKQICIKNKPLVFRTENNIIIGFDNLDYYNHQKEYNEYKRLYPNQSKILLKLLEVLK